MPTAKKFGDGKYGDPGQQAVTQNLEKAKQAKIPHSQLPRQAAVQRVANPGNVQGQHPAPQVPMPAEDEIVMQASQAERVLDGTELTVPGQEPVQQPQQTVAGNDPLQTILEKYSNDPQQMAKALLHASRKVTEVTNAHAGLQENFNTLLNSNIATKQTGPVQDTSVAQAPVMDFSQEQATFESMMLEDPKKAFQSIVSVAGKIAEQKTVENLSKLEEQQAQDQIQGLIAQYPGMVTKDNWPFVETMANMIPGQTRQQRYIDAFAQYAEQTGYQTPLPGNIQEQGQTVEEMTKAAEPVPLHGGQHPAAQKFTQKQIDDMLINNPEQYKQFQQDIANQYAKQGVQR